MSQKGLETQRNYPLHKKVREFFWGGWCMQTNWNYERQMNTAFMWGISKTLDRLYPDPKDEEKKKERYRGAFRRNGAHSVFQLHIRRLPKGRLSGPCGTNAVMQTGRPHLRRFSVRKLQHRLFQRVHIRLCRHHGRDADDAAEIRHLHIHALLGQPVADLKAGQPRAAHVDHQCYFGNIFVRFLTELGKFRDQRSRQIINAEKAHILKYFDRVTFTRSAQSGNNRHFLNHNFRPFF